jgi:hypothetical protein
MLNKETGLQRGHIMILFNSHYCKGKTEKMCGSQGVEGREGVRTDNKRSQRNH